LQHRFACTQCGQCCNRSPEVELSEAAALADVFVFRLLFRLYRLPWGLGGSEAFFQKKRLLAGYAARKRSVRTRAGGRVVEETEYLVISALTLDTGTGVCGALEAGTGSCGIYARRPFACRTVPLHYTGVDAAATSELEAFVATPGYRCDAGENAAVVLEDGRIVDSEMGRARVDALAAAERDGPWKQAIVRRMKAGQSGGLPLPTMRQVEASAAHGALTTSMRAGWQVAVDAGLMEADACEALLRAQLATMERELTLGCAGPDARKTLAEMRAEYRHHLAM
jgi:Fe-S-cluster containining protein